MKALITRWPWINGCLAGLAYGLLVQLMGRTVDDEFVVMSLGFVILLPLSMGVLTVYTAPERFAGKWLYRIFAPWLVVAGLCCARFGRASGRAPHFYDGYFSFVTTLSPPRRFIVIWFFAASNSMTTAPSI